LLLLGTTTTTTTANYNHFAPRRK